MELKEIYVSEDNNYFKSIDGVLFTKDGTELLLYPPRKEVNSYVIPDTVRKVGRISHIYAKHIYIPSKNIVLCTFSSTTENVFVPESLIDAYKAQNPYQEELFKPLPENWEDLIQPENQEDSPLDDESVNYSLQAKHVTLENAY